jgi:hypothetical protein
MIVQAVVVADTAAALVVRGTSSADGCLEVHVHLECLDNILALPSLSRS